MLERYPFNRQCYSHGNIGNGDILILDVIDGACRAGIGLDPGSILRIENNGVGECDAFDLIQIVSYSNEAGDVGPTVLLDLPPTLPMLRPCPPLQNMLLETT